MWSFRRRCAVKTRSVKKSVTKLPKRSPKKSGSAAKTDTQLRAIAQSYFEGLAKKDLSAVPWGDDPHFERH